MTTSTRWTLLGSLSLAATLGLGALGCAASTGAPSEEGTEAAAQPITKAADATEARGERRLQAEREEAARAERERLELQAAERAAAERAATGPSAAVLGPSAGDGSAVARPVRSGLRGRIARAGTAVRRRLSRD